MEEADSNCNGGVEILCAAVTAGGKGLRLSTGGLTRAVGRWKCNASRRGCGGIDAAPQPPVRSDKTDYTEKHEAKGYPEILAAPFDSTRRRG